MPQHRGVQLSSTAGPNAHNQIGSLTTAACVKLCRLDKSLAARWRLPIPLTCVLCVFVWLNRHCSTRCGQHSASGLDRIAVGRWVWRVLPLFRKLRLVGFSYHNQARVQRRAGPRSANLITRPILPPGQWADIKIYNRNACLWSSGIWMKLIPGAGELVWS